jgi:hypothetical protein
MRSSEWLRNYRYPREFPWVKTGDKNFIERRALNYETGLAQR